MTEHRSGLYDAIQSFWDARNTARERGRASDQGQRSAATSGRQLEGLLDLIVATVEASFPGESVEALRKRRTPVIPGYYRPEKEWDLVIMAGSQLGAVIELKSHVGPSFGNNFNNRAEEALGSADDFWTAYREGAFGMSAVPWAGYFLLLEDHESSRRPVKVSEPIFKVFDEFKEASYAMRYELLLRRMMRERRYTATCMVLSTNPAEEYLRVTEPGSDMIYERRIRSLIAHLRGVVE